MERVGRFWDFLTFNKVSVLMFGAHDTVPSHMQSSTSCEVSDRWTSPLVSLLQSTRCNEVVWFFNHGRGFVILTFTGRVNWNRLWRDARGGRWCGDASDGAWCASAATMGNDGVWTWTTWTYSQPRSTFTFTITSKLAQYSLSSLI